MPTTLVHDRGSPVPTVEAVLAPLHDRWIERLARMLAPALAPGASFWERWGATRFLNDEFASRFARHCELADGLAGVLTPAARLRLDAGRGEIERLLGRLVAAGRRRGTAGPVASLGRQLIEWTRLWCDELEAAAREIPLAAMPDDGRELVARLSGGRA